eukprot:4810498-Pyramimonas_sp.AAC.1
MEQYMAGFCWAPHTSATTKSARPASPRGRRSAPPPKRAGKPWVIAGDWNVEPESSLQRAEHLRRVGGHVVDASAGACQRSPTKAPSELD